MNDGAYQFSLHDQQRNGIETMAMHANRLGLWVFDSQKNAWHTPEEL